MGTISILNNYRKCYKCGTIFNLHKHHIYGGPNRKVSEANGFYVYLCARHHNMSDEGVHFDKAFDTDLKQQCQQKYEETHSREQFMELIGRSYL